MTHVECAKNREGLLAPSSSVVELFRSVSLFADVDPYQPEASCDDAHECIEQKAPELILVLVPGHLVPFVVVSL